MLQQNSFVTRRHLLRSGVAWGAGSLFTRGVFAEQLFPTPRLTEGPFYPNELPLDQDNDLLIINDAITPAVGEVTHLTGRVLSTSGEPVRDAVVEIWQCDAHAVYLHTADSGPKKHQQDRNFQGFGRFTTDSLGRYRFRTIKPVAYPIRPAPHIHVKVKKGERELLTTQLLVRGHPGNAQDRVFLNTRDPIDRELLLVDFLPMKESKLGELAATFDIVLGRTPDENSIDPRPRSEPSPSMKE